MLTVPETTTVKTTITGVATTTTTATSTDNPVKSTDEPGIDRGRLAAANSVEDIPVGRSSLSIRQKSSLPRLIKRLENIWTKESGEVRNEEDVLPKKDTALIVSKIR